MGSKHCLVVFYHYVRDMNSTPFPNLKALDISDFNQQLDWLQETFTVISYNEFIRGLKNPDQAVENGVLLTFDDGLIDHYATVYPILKERGLSGVFFLSAQTCQERQTVLNVHKAHFILAQIGASAFQKEVLRRLKAQGINLQTNNDKREGIYRYDEMNASAIKRFFNYEAPFPVVYEILSELFTLHLGDERMFAQDLYLSEKMLAEMSNDGMTFGGHSETHKVLSRLSKEEQYKEMEASYVYLQDILPSSTVSFCYPHGHRHTYNHETLECLREIGYEAAFNTVRENVNYTSSPSYELPRLDTKDIFPFIN